MNQSKSKSNGKKKKVKIIEVPYKPREYQKEVHNNRKRFSVLVCHRRFGKSVLSINELIKTAADKPRSLCAFIAPTYRQGKAIGTRAGAKKFKYPNYREFNKKGRKII